MYIIVYLSNIICVLLFNWAEWKHSIVAMAFYNIQYIHNMK